VKANDRQECNMQHNTRVRKRRPRGIAIVGLVVAGAVGTTAVGFATANASTPDKLPTASDPSFEIAGFSSSYDNKTENQVSAYNQAGQKVPAACEQAGYSRGEGGTNRNFNVTDSREVEEDGGVTVVFIGNCVAQ
jgi:hypothetical protein